MSPADASAPVAVLLPWDTEFFGFPIGRVTSDRLTPETARQLIAWAGAERIRCLYLFANASCARTLSLAHETGFKFVDLRLDFALDLKSSPSASSADDFRAAEASDLPALETLSRDAHTDTRFSKDSGFPAARSAELYAQWICRDFHTHRVFTVGRIDGAAAGYVSCQIDPATRLGRIGLIAVSAQARGRGLGRALVQGAITWFAKSGCHEVRVVTQGSNVPAQRLYQSFGFKTATASAIFHRWS